MFPYLGDRPVTEISAQDRLAVARRIESRGALPPAKHEHMAALADDPAQVAEILRATEAFKGGPVVHAAHAAGLGRPPGRAARRRQRGAAATAVKTAGGRTAFP